RAHQRVPERYLPLHDPLPGALRVDAVEAGVAAEVGRVPPRRAAVAVNELVEAGVAVVELGEGHVEARLQGAVEGGGAPPEGIHLLVGRVLERDVGLRAPDAQVVPEA